MLDALNNQQNNQSQQSGGLSVTTSGQQQQPAITSGLEQWYRTNLGREADQPGLQYWSGQFGETLDPNEINILQQAPEYQNRQFLTGLYKTELGRDPDQPGLQYWMDELNRGMSKEDIQKSFNLNPEGQVYDFYQQYLGRAPDEGGQYWTSALASGADPRDVERGIAESDEGRRQFIKNLYQTELGRAPDEPGFESWLNQINQGMSREDIQKSFNLAPEGQVYDFYQQYLGRAPDERGQDWVSALVAGADPQEIAKGIAMSPEARGLRAGELSGLFTKDFGEEFTNTLTADEMNKFTDLYADITAKQKYTAPVKQNEFDREFYLQQNPDVARAGVDPYQHYLEYGFNEGRAPNATGPGAMTADQRYQEVLRQAALDPELGAIIKAKDPFLYESLTPLTSNPDQQKTTERIRYGQYGTYNVDGVDVPILNAKVADQILGRDQFGEVQDFSHGRGRALAELGWTGNSFSNKLARGAEAIGVKKYSDGEGNFGYTGLDEAARIVGLDTSKFADKQVPMLTREGFDENGNYVPGGQPVYMQDEYGNVMRDPQTGEPVPTMTWLSRDQQIYDAINEAAKDIYLYTGDSLTPGRASEGGGQSFDTVLYKRVGDELIPITKPTAHGGYQNLDVYTGGSGFNFGRDIAPGLIFVGGAALAWTGAGALASQIGNFITAPIGSALGTTIPAGVSSVVGGITIGAATGALTAAATGTDIGQGALKGGVAGGVGAAMPQVLNNLPGMGGVVNGIASSLNLNPADVSSVVSSTLSRTLATAAAGANGDQILNAFGTALASTTLGAAGANAVKSVFADSFTPAQLAGMARATQLVTNAAATSLISGGSTEQVANSVINSLVSGAGSIQQAADKATNPPAKLTKAELDAWMQGQEQVQTGQSPYYEVASADGTTQLVKRGEVTVTQGPQDVQGAALETPTLPPEEEAEYARQIAEQDAKVQSSLANKASEIVTKLENTDVTDDYILDALNLFDIPKTTAKIALDMSKAGATREQITAALSKGDGTTTGTGTTTTGTTTGTGTGGTTTGTGTTTGGTGTGEGGGEGEGSGGGDGTGLGGGEGDGTGGTGTGGTGTGGTGTGGTGGGISIPTLPTIPSIPKITAARKIADEDLQGIYNLTPGYTKGNTDYQLAGQFKMADGGSVTQYDPYGISGYERLNSGVSDVGSTPFIGSDVKMPKLTAGVTDAILDYVLPGLFKFAQGGSVPGGHNPKFFSEGGLNSLENRYVTGEGDGTSDSIPAMLANGEFVIPADVVSSLGNGSNDAGAAALDEFLNVIREHKQKHDAKKLPPDSKGPLAYLLEAKKRA